MPGRSEELGRSDVRRLLIFRESAGKVVRGVSVLSHGVGRDSGQDDEAQAGRTVGGFSTSPVKETQKPKKKDPSVEPEPMAQNEAIHQW